MATTQGTTGVAPRALALWSASVEECTPCLGGRVPFAFIFILLTYLVMLAQGKRKKKKKLRVQEREDAFRHAVQNGSMLWIIDKESGTNLQK